MIEKGKLSPTLSGIRTATTDQQQLLIRRATAVLKDFPGILAAWLVGSFATGDSDAFSDIDLHCLVVDQDDWSSRGGALIDAITPVVQVRPIRETIGWACITPEWIHIDIVLHSVSSYDVSSLRGMLPLFDKSGKLGDEPRPRSPWVGPPYYPSEAVDWFFYLLGNLVTVVGRGEYILGTNGAVVVRDECLVPLMLAENGIRRVGGRKRLRPLLSAEQLEVLSAMPPLQVAQDSVIAAYLYLAREFIPRGRDLAARTNRIWPDAMETATIRYLEHSLGMDFALS